MPPIKPSGKKAIIKKVKLIILIGSHVDAKQARHAMKIILIPGHRQYFRNDRALRPLDAELLDEFFQIVRGCLTNGVHVIN